MTNYDKPRQITRSGIIITNCNDELLIIKGHKTNKWGFPKGSIEDGETSQQCAIREFNEETGMKLSGEEISEGEFVDMGCHYYILTLPLHQLTSVSEIDKNEISEVQWIHEKKIKYLIKNTSLGRYYNSVIKPKYKKEKKRKTVVEEDGWVKVL